MLEIIVVIIYVFLLLAILFYCLLEAGLAINYLRYKNKYPLPKLLSNELEEKDYPKVCVQLPIFNELYVVERLIDAVCQLNYPKEKLEIQVLDDSTDETLKISEKKVNYYKQQGFNIKLVRRPNRKGYKAGALQYGLERSDCEFVAIFDADFIPDKNFLMVSLPHFKENIGMVQTRWDHLNKDYSLLTRIQAFFLDNHFAVEQSGRNLSGYFINFNGTAGIWRKQCILDAGGWQADTLTEDLDLSYRAQLKNWEFVYLENVLSPAELPADMRSFKSQQFRWIKGGAETAMKLIPKIAKSKLPLMVKLNAFSHLLSSSIYLIVFLTVVFSLPLLMVKNTYIETEYVHYALPFTLSNIAVAFIYFVSIVKKDNLSKSFLEYLVILPFFLIITMGLSLHNTIALVRGFAGEQTPFIRTPKFNIKAVGDIWADNKYIGNRKIDWVTIFEGVMVLYFIAGIVLAFYRMEFGLLPLHIMAVLGFGIVFVYSLRHSWR